MVKIRIYFPGLFFFFLAWVRREKYLNVALMCLISKLYLETLKR